MRIAKHECDKADTHILVQGKLACMGSQWLNGQLALTATQSLKQADAPCMEQTLANCTLHFSDRRRRMISATIVVEAHASFNM
jgi:hypothetical protein